MIKKLWFPQQPELTASHTPRLRDYRYASISLHRGCSRAGVAMGMEGWILCWCVDVKKLTGPVMACFNAAATCVSAAAPWCLAGYALNQSQDG